MVSTKERVVVYTAICGNYDELRDPPQPVDDFDYVCFTDNPSLRSRVWKLRRFDEHFSDPVRTAKKPKILPHRYFPEYDTSVWVDANLDHRGDLRALLQRGLAEENLSLFRHPEDRAGIRAEAEACIRAGKDDPETIARQIETYRAAGYSGDTPIPACMVILRRHRDPRVMEAMEDWWSEIARFSRRDQLSFHFVAAKRGLAYSTIDENVRSNEWLEWRPHDLKAKRERLERRTRDADVVVLSVPKSGRTWLRYFLAQYRFHRDGRPLSLDFPPAERSPGVLFTHNYFDLFQDCRGEPRLLFAEDLARKRCVILTRDPRDVVTSYYHQKRAREGVAVGSLRNFAGSDIYGVERVSAFVLELLDFAAASPESRLVLAYEDLQRDPPAEFRRFLRFVDGTAPDDHSLDTATKASGFDTMREVEIALCREQKTGELFHRLGTPNWNGDLNALKVRRGRVGGFRREMDWRTRWLVERGPRTRAVIARMGELGEGGDP